MSDQQTGNKIDELVKTITEKLAAEIAEMQKTNRDKNQTIAEKDRVIDRVTAEKDRAIVEKIDAVEEMELAIAEKITAFDEKESAIHEKEMAILEKEQAIAEKEKVTADYQLIKQNLIAENSKYYETIAEKERVIQEKDAEKDAIIEEKNKIISELGLGQDKVLRRERQLDDMALRLSVYKKRIAEMEAVLSELGPNDMSATDDLTTKKLQDVLARLKARLEELSNDPGVNEEDDIIDEVSTVTSESEFGFLA